MSAAGGGDTGSKPGTPQQRAVADPPTARLERLLDRPASPDPGPLLAGRTRRVLAIAAAAFVVIVGPMAFPFWTESWVMRPWYWTHDVLALPLKGRLWVDLAPSSYVAASVVFIVILAMLLVRRYWAYGHFSTADRLYATALGRRAALGWLHVFGARAPRRYLFAAVDYVADRAAAAGPAEERAASAVLAPSRLRRQLDLAVDPSAPYEAAVRLLDAQAHATAPLTAVRSEARAWLARFGGAEEPPIDAAIDAFVLAARAPGPGESATFAGLETLVARGRARIKAMSAAATEGRDERCRWPDGGACARRLAYALAAQAGDPDLAERWWEAEARAQFAQDRLAVVGPAETEARPYDFDPNSASVAPMAGLTDPARSEERFHEVSFSFPDRPVAFWRPMPELSLGAPAEPEGNGEGEASS